MCVRLRVYAPACVFYCTADVLSNLVLAHYSQGGWGCRAWLMVCLVSHFYCSFSLFFALVLPDEILEGGYS